MKKFFMAVIVLMMTVSVSAQFYIYLSNGDVLEVDKISLVKPPISGELLGEFSVSSTTKVHFSQGNLQYVGTWQFAEHQWDYFGNNQSENHRDLFYLYTCDDPYDESVDDDNHTFVHTFVDWGTNAITNGGNTANQWRTLTPDEWVYLFMTRANAATLFGLGSVNGVNGTILLPDYWVLPNGASFTPSTMQGLVNVGLYYTNGGNGNDYSHNTYTVEQWSVMEYAGAVFLPAAGIRLGTDVSDAGSDGTYWSKVANDECSLYFYSGNFVPKYWDNRYGRSVRLVR